MEAGIEEEDDKRCMSVREAVKFAKANNLLGVMLDATLIVSRPSAFLSLSHVAKSLTIHSSYFCRPKSLISSTREFSMRSDAFFVRASF